MLALHGGDLSLTRWRSRYGRPAIYRLSPRTRRQSRMNSPVFNRSIASAAYEPLTNHGRARQNISPASFVSRYEIDRCCLPPSSRSEVRNTPTWRACAGAQCTTSDSPGLPAPRCLRATAKSLPERLQMFSWAASVEGGLDCQLHGGDSSTSPELAMIQSKASFSVAKPSMRRSWPW